jgi:anti-sigma-K factor RskA
MHLLTGAYAVNALDPAERAAFEEHLAGCPECAAEVAGLLETTARLASSQAVTPPARLKESVLAQIATTRQISPSPAAAGPVLSRPRSPAATDEAGGPAPDEASAVVALRRPGWSWAQRSVAIAAAVLTFVAVGLATLLVQADHARSQLDATQQAVSRVLTAADAHSISGSIAGAGKATIVVSASEGTSVLLGTGLPPAPAGHTYELWYLGGAHTSPVPAGTFNPDPSGHATAVLTGTIAGAAGIAVTVEPAGGSPAPTTKPVLAVQLPA